MDFSNTSSEDLQAQRADLVSQAESLQESGDLEALSGVLDQIDAIDAELKAREDSAEGDASVELAQRFSEIKRVAIHSKSRKTSVDRVSPTSRKADTFENMKARYNFATAIIDRLDGRNHQGAEAEYIQEARYRNPKLQGIPVPRFQSYAGANTTDAPNAQTRHYVPDQVDMLRAGSIVDKLGVTVMDNLTEATTWTVQTGDPSGNWVGEGNNSADGTPQYNQVTVSPKTNILIVPTTRLFLLTVPNAAAQLQKQIAEKARREYDLAFVNGAGGNAPTGVLNDSSIQGNAGSTYNFAGNLTLDGVVAMEAQCATNNGLGENPKWLTNYKVRAQGRKTAKGANIYDTIIDDEERMIGYEVFANSLVPANLGASPFNKSPLIFFGDPSTCIAAIFGSDNFDVVVDQYTQLASGGVRLALPFSCDFKFLQPGKIVVAKDITAG